MTIARRQDLEENKLSRVNLSFKPCLIQNFLAHSLGPILFSHYTPCNNSPLVSKIKMVSPVLIILLLTIYIQSVNVKGVKVVVFTKRNMPAEK